MPGVHFLNLKDVLNSLHQKGPPLAFLAIFVLDRVFFFPYNLSSELYQNLIFFDCRKRIRLPNSTNSVAGRFVASNRKSRHQRGGPHEKLYSLHDGTDR